MRAKKIIAVLSAMLIMSTIGNAQASDIPREVLPPQATEVSVAVVERLIGDILTETQQGLGYADAMVKANKRIIGAVLANQTEGYGYGLLGSIARNAVFQYRDMYLRPDYYKAADENVRNLIGDLIEQVRQGRAYEEARKEAYIRILKNADPNFNPADCYMTDFCYWDVPQVDSALFTVARKLLLTAISQ